MKHPSKPKCGIRRQLQSGGGYYHNTTVSSFRSYRATRNAGRPWRSLSGAGQGMGRVPDRADISLGEQVRATALWVWDAAPNRMFALLRPNARSSQPKRRQAWLRPAKRL